MSDAAVNKAKTLEKVNPIALPDKAGSGTLTPAEHLANLEQNKVNEPKKLPNIEIVRNFIHRGSGNRGYSEALRALTEMGDRAKRLKSENDELRNNVAVLRFRMGGLRGYVFGEDLRPLALPVPVEVPQNFEDAPTPAEIPLAPVPPPPPPPPPMDPEIVKILTYVGDAPSSVTFSDLQAVFGEVGTIMADLISKRLVRCWKKGGEDCYYLNPTY